MDHPQLPEDRSVQLLKDDELGSGSYGVVCKAKLGQCLCAAKLLHPIFFQSNDPGMVTTRRRFEQECRFLNDMKHPHIVEFLGTSHDPDSGLLVLLMELMDESLTHFLERSQQPLAYRIEVDLCHDIAQALAYIHSKEIIHRNLSGNNVLLIADRAKITDFGMSKLLDSNRRMTPLTMYPGTLVYMPPEALSELPVYSKNIDCFSFGVLQIQIMTRQFPDPGPAVRVVEDSRSPTGTTRMPVLDSERRKSHIDLIDPTHPLLPTALGCLSYSEKDRPSGEDLCRQLAAFKEGPRYTQLQTLQQELQTKDLQLQHSERHTDQTELGEQERRHLANQPDSLQSEASRLRDANENLQAFENETITSNTTVTSKSVASKKAVTSTSKAVTLTQKESKLASKNAILKHQSSIIQKPIEHLTPTFERKGSPRQKPQVFATLFRKKKYMRILMLGLDASGKTTVLYRLKVGKTMSTTPTVSFNVETVTYKNVKFNVWDVGGIDKTRSLWRHYYTGTQGLIFVVDCADRDRIDEARQELHRIVKDREMKDAIILIFANKQDLPDAMKPVEVQEKLALTMLHDRNWYVQPCCATSGDGLHEGLTWLTTYALI